MPYIRKRKKKDGSMSYTVTVRIKGSPEISKTFKRLTDAKEWAHSTESKIRENINFPQRKIQNMTIAEMIDGFIENELPNKKERIRNDFRKTLEWFKKEIGQIYVRNLTTADMVACREKLRKRKKMIPGKNSKHKLTDKSISNATVNRHLTYMRVVFSYYVNELDILDVNPMAKVKKLPEKNNRTRCLEQDEITKLLVACKKKSQELYLCVLMAILTGARKMEILKLTWREVDLHYKTLTFLETKNGEDRCVPMHEVLFEEIVEFQKQTKIKHLKNDYIFKNTLGNPNTRLVEKYFPRMVRECGIEDFRFHDLRHTQASYQARNGINQPATQKTLGHKTSAMTNRYSHLIVESLRTPINVAGDAILKDYKAIMNN